MLSFVDLVWGARAVLSPWKPELNDVNEENDPPETRRSRGPQVKSSLRSANVCNHGLVLLEGLSVAVLIQPFCSPEVAVL